MTNIRQQVRQLESHSKQELKEILAAELGDSYDRSITNSLRNDFMWACYNAIEPNQPLQERLKDHPEYSPSWLSWGTKRQLATALRLVLTEYVNRPQSQGLTSLDKRALSELIVAIRIATGQIEVSDSPSETDLTDSTSMNSPPTRTSPPECPFSNTLSADRFESYDLYTWIVANRDETDGEHGVYVLDCTPPVNGEERSRLTTLRQGAYEKAQAGKQLNSREQAAQAVTNGERIYYVGYAADVPARVQQHSNGRAAGGADFTNMFKPVALVDVSWYDSEATARKHEALRADELSVPGESHAYWG